MGRRLRAFAPLPDDLELIFSTHMAVQQAQLWFQRNRGPLQVFWGTKHTSGAQVHVQAKAYTHRIELKVKKRTMPGDAALPKPGMVWCRACNPSTEGGGGRGTRSASHPCVYIS